MNWFTITLLVLAIAAAAVVTYEVMRPKRGRVDYDAHVRELDQGEAYGHGGT